MSRKTLNLFALIMVVALVLTACAQPVPAAPAAQAPAGEAAAGTGGEAAAPAGEAQRGGVWSRLTSTDVAGSLNFILSDNAAASDVGYMLYDIGLLGGDLDTGEINCDGALCESWDVSDDGLVYTFKLRQGLEWSDGEEINADDFLFTYNAVNSDLVETARKYLWEGIESMEAPDPYTVIVTYSDLKCSALGFLGALPMVPSHLYAPDFSDVMTSPENDTPTVGSGPFVFKSRATDDNVIIERNENYRDGAPYMDGMIYRVVPDAGSRLAQLQNGESDALSLQGNQLSAVAGNPNITVYPWKDDGYSYISLNLANPANPQPGLDENGNPIPQDPHPILGDKRVRQAIAQAIDYDSIIEDIFFGQGYRITANVLPAIEWAYNNDLEPWQYDVEAASALLEEAGWVDSNGDGIREKDGQDLTLGLLTNAGNTTRENLGAYVQDALGDVGINVDFQAVDFGTLLERNNTQTFDMIILGWTGTGTDPDDRALFAADADIPGSGFNTTSFYNEEYERLSIEGNAVTGCAIEDRAPYYKQIQEIMHEEVPYVFVTGTVGNMGYNSRWEGIDPKPWTNSAPLYWNTHEWYLRTAE